MTRLPLLGRSQCLLGSVAGDRPTVLFEEGTERVIFFGFNRAYTPFHPGAPFYMIYLDFRDTVGR